MSRRYKEIWKALQLVDPFLRNKNSKSNEIPKEPHIQNWNQIMGYLFETRKGTSKIHKKSLSDNKEEIHPAENFEPAAKIKEIREESYLEVPAITDYKIRGLKTSSPSVDIWNSEEPQDKKRGADA
eukprot:GHVP01020449.1.p1 GENE.GHVP01020449.1~~GHVP01020449.1.p1  ORF type:complete len:126 (-),score=27.53 GHVP01020449.1:497-874(-)